MTQLKLLNNRLYRVSKKDKCYTGALCGLGYDQQLRRPMYLEDDIEDLFEAEFQDEDIRHVSYYVKNKNKHLQYRKTSRLGSKKIYIDFSRPRS
jgi:hypothetical protein